MPGYARRVDNNHGEIRRAFRDLGCSVVDLSRVGEGCPDLLIARNGFSALVEVKVPGEDLRANQKEFRDGWKGRLFLVSSVDEAVRVVAALV